MFKNKGNLIMLMTAVFFLTNMLVTYIKTGQIDLVSVLINTFIFGFIYSLGTFFRERNNKDDK